MPRQPRLEVPGLMYHIISRGIERKEIFKDENDYNYFLDRFGKILVDTDVKCFAFTLMPNHFHLLLKSGNIPASNVMRRLLTSYAVYFNKKHRRVGHLFQNRYKSIICQEDTYLLELVRYLHLNPVRAKLINTLNELSTYRFSGHSAILGKVKYGWYNPEDVLCHFATSKRKAINKYLEFIRDGESISKDQRFSGGGLKRSLNFPSNYPKERWAYDDRILGDSEYVLSLQSYMEKIPTEKDKTSVDDIIKKVAKSYGLSYEQVCGKSRIPTITKARANIAYQAAIKLGLSFAEIARHLNVNRSTIARMIPRIKEDAVTSNKGE